MRHLLQGFFRGIRTKFILIYLLFGLIPLLVIPYHSFHSASETLERLTDQQLVSLTSKTANQTSHRFREIRKDIDLLSGYPFIQLAFLQFSFGQRLETVATKLQRYRGQNELYSRISLIAPDGEILLTVPRDDERLVARQVDRGRLSRALAEETFVSGVLNDHPEGPLVIFGKRVHDFEDITMPVGLLAFYVRLEALTSFLAELAPAPEATGFIWDRGLGRLLAGAALPIDSGLWAETVPGEGEVRIVETGGYRLFLADVPELAWTVGLVLPRDALLGEIKSLRSESLSLVLTVAVLALLTTFFLVRRITDPIAQLTRGAKEFSTGNLDHRIAIRGEGELRRLGEEFNAMAATLKNRERQVRQVDRLASLGILAAGVAHEVRNPLAGMKSCAQLMQRKAIAPEVAMLARGIDEEIDRLDRLVRELLHFAHPGEPSPRRFAPAAMLEKVLEMTRKSLEETGVMVETEFAPAPEVWADADQVRQIFLNLILNAAKAMQEGGRLRLAVRIAGNQVAVTIADSGCGIPPEHLDRIFDPFFTLTPGGTGLGLSVAHSLMQENGIAFHLESAPGKGTLFELYFDTTRGKRTWHPS